MPKLFSVSKVLLAQAAGLLASHSSSAEQTQQSVVEQFFEQGSLSLERRPSAVSNVSGDVLRPAGNDLSYAPAPRIGLALRHRAKFQERLWPQNLSSDAESRGLSESWMYEQLGELLLSYWATSLQRERLLLKVPEGYRTGESSPSFSREALQLHSYLCRLLAGENATEDNIAELRDSPGLIEFLSVVLEFRKLGLLQGSPRQALPHLDVAAQVARLLHTLDERTSTRSVLMMLDALMRAQSELGEVNPFYGRAVVVAAHNEKIEDVYRDSHRPTPLELLPRKQDFRFVTPRLAQAVMAQAVTSIFLRTEVGSSAQQIHAATVEAIATLAPAGRGFTFVFDGHGLPEGLALTSGRIPNPRDRDPYADMSVADVAGAIAQRAARYGARVESDVYIFEGCRTAEFARNVARELKKLAVAVPVFIAPVEVSQNFYTKWSSAYHSAFFERLITSRLEPSKVLKATFRTGDGDQPVRIESCKIGNIFPYLSGLPNASVLVSGRYFKKFLPPTYARRLSDFDVIQIN